MLDQKFYVEMFKAWANIKYSEPENINEILNQPIWDNDLMQIGYKTIRYNAWIRAGIHHIADLVNNQ